MQASGLRGAKFYGARLSFDSGANNFTLMGAHVTRGVYQVESMGELDVNWRMGATIGSSRHALVWASCEYLELVILMNATAS